MKRENDFENVLSAVTNGLSNDDKTKREDFVDIDFIKQYFVAHSKTVVKENTKYIKEWCENNKDKLNQYNCYDEFLYNSIIKLWNYPTNLYEHNRDPKNINIKEALEFYDFYVNDLFPRKKEYISTIAMWLCFYHSTMLDEGYKEIYKKYQKETDEVIQYALSVDNGNKKILEFLLEVKKMIEDKKIPKIIKKKILQTKHDKLKKEYEKWLTTDQYDGVFHYFLNK